MATTWFTSDEHIKHANNLVYSKRDFKDVEEMRLEFIRRHNERVKDNDLVWHLGDVALDHRVVGDYIKSLNGRHILVPGNHDACHPRHGNSRSMRMAKRYKEEYGFEEVMSLEVERRIRDIDVLISHMPYIGDHTERDRYVQYRPMNKGAWLLHGHAHQAWKVRDKQLNVGVDQWNYAPVSEDEVYEIIKGG